MMLRRLRENASRRQEPASRKSRSFRPPFETLERRHLLTEVPWDAGDGFLRWSNPLSCTGDPLPATGTNVVIDAAGDAQINYDLSDPTSIQSPDFTDSLKLTTGLDGYGTGPVATHDGEFSRITVNRRWLGCHLLDQFSWNSCAS